MKDKDIYIIDKGFYKVCIDFGEIGSNDFAVEQTYQYKNGAIYMTNHKVLGKSSDFTDEKRHDYLLKIQEDKNE